jgi:hypothetical protein
MEADVMLGNFHHAPHLAHCGCAAQLLRALLQANQDFLLRHKSSENRKPRLFETGSDLNFWIGS